MSKVIKKRKKSTRKKSGTKSDSNQISEITEQVKTLMSSVKINDVSMIRCQSQRVDSLVDDVTLSIRYSAHGERSTDKKFVRTIINFRLDGRKKNEEKSEPALFIEATFLALYDIPENISTDKNTLQAFADMNGTFNLWPYWREFVSSISTRIGLPALTVPSFRVNKAQLHTTIQNLLKK